MPMLLKECPRVLAQITGLAMKIQTASPAAIGLPSRGSLPQRLPRATGVTRPSAASVQHRCSFGNVPIGVFGHEDGWNTGDEKLMVGVTVGSLVVELAKRYLNHPPADGVTIARVWCRRPDTDMPKLARQGSLAKRSSGHDASSLTPRHAPNPRYADPKFRHNLAGS
jgi:hypothetical protein